MLMRLTLLSMALTVALPTYADTRLDLLDTLRLADQFDPNLAAVRATQAAAAQGTNISRAALLPRVVAGGSISDITLKQERPDQMTGIVSNTTTDYRSEQYSIKITQPLFRWDAWHQHQAAKALRSQSEADAADQTQTLFLAVAEAYLNVLRAQDNLDLAQAQEVALERQREQADARFKVGVVARTDVLEASAQRDNATALRISAEIALNSAREVLNAAVGRDIGELARLQETLPLEAPIPDDANAWTQLARERNPGLIAARLNTQAAKANRQAQRGGYLPQVDLIASYSDRQNKDVSNDNISITFNSGSNEVIGIEAQWELFASGRTLASVKQASLQADAAEAVAKAREHQVVNNARTGFLTVKADSFRLQAREQAQASAQLAYDAVQAGYRAGTRNIVDVLLAETALFAAKRDYANARYDYIVNTLRLHASAGMLAEPLIERINAWLVK